jgi:hypothetical protein
MSEARHYSLRRLSPYQGTVQVIESKGLRAMSVDGVTWRVQIQHAAAGGRPGRLRSTFHGTWRADGSGDLIETARTAAWLAVLRSHPPLPFPLADQMELWLLDADRAQPLALLAATFPRAVEPRHADTRFRAIAPGEPFVSPSLAVLQAVGEAPEASDVPHGELLARFVRDAAGASPRAQWFRRHSDGSGVGAGLGPELEGRRLARASFPELIVREQWDNEVAGDLVRDYHAWRAALLLTHDNLSRETRARLELAACRQADKLYRLRHVLPEVVQPERLRVAMVEAVIRSASEPAVS